jgi:formamidopyrimidine-DNA glycosylase
MPELPEVETIKRGLESKLVGLTIQKIDISNPKSFQGDEHQLIGATVTGLWRRAKLLGIDLSNGQSLLIHLKMSGQIILVQHSTTENPKSRSKRFAGGHPTKDMMEHMPNRSTRVTFTLVSQDFHKPETYNLYFNDQRKFGWIKLVPTSELADFDFYSKLGPEPLEKSFTPEVLQQVLSRHPRLPVKVAILDQSAIAGIGNIYASEACFLANLHPNTAVQSLTDSDYTNLHRGIVESLNSSIKYGGSSKHTYVNASGGKGYFLEVANVYDRQNQPCRICNTLIIKTTLAGRGTYFCPKCQNG